MLKITSPEILLQIFKNLPLHDLRKNISLVCRQWHKVVYDFHLIRSESYLKSPFYSNGLDIMEDFQKYPTFATKLKLLSISDVKEDGDCEFLYEEEFIELIESCPNLEDLKIRVALFSNLLKMLPDIVSPKKKPLLPKLKVLDIDYSEIVDTYEEVDPCTIDLWKLVNQVMPDLQKLIVNASIDTRHFLSHFFPRYGPQRSVNSSLQTIKIVSPGSTMTRNCVDYIISGHFPKLENLDLFVTLFQKEKVNVLEMETEKEEDEIWDRLKAFCLTSLKNYNIYFREKESRAYIFSIDNCEDKTTSYEVINRTQRHTGFSSDSENGGGGGCGAYFFDSDDSDYGGYYDYI